MAGAGKRRRPQVEPNLEGLEDRLLLSRLRPHTARLGARLHAASLGTSNTPSVLGLSVNVRAQHPTYRPGQPVTFVATETNPTNHDVTVVSGTQVLFASIWRDGVEVWRRGIDTSSPTTFLTLHPGQSRELTLQWDGRFAPPLPGPAMPVTGPFQIQVQLDGAVGESSFLIRGH